MAKFTPQLFRSNSAPIGRFYDWAGAPIGGQSKPGAQVFAYQQVTEGQSFGQKNPRSPDGKYRHGGPWLMDKHDHVWTGSSTSVFRASWARAYQGAFHFSDGGDWLDWGLPNEDIDAHWSKVNSYGAQAYAALKPDYPDFQPATSLYELKDIPAQLKEAYQALFWKMSRNRLVRAPYRSPGRFHLAVQFGWLPLFSDTCSFVEAFANRKKRFNQLLRDEGKPVRRHRNISKDGNDEHTPDKHENLVLNTAYHPNMSPTLVTQCYSGGKATQQGSSYSNTKIWCAGQARYMLPPGPRDDGWRKDMMRRILGLQIEPLDVYNAIPWTWLGNYFTSLGTFVKAVSGGIADNVVFDYAYIMHQAKFNYTVQASQFVVTGMNPTTTGQVFAGRTLNETRNTRMAASPLGWGYEGKTLNPKQLAILGSLGLSRL